MKNDFEIELARSEDGRNKVRIIDRKTAIKGMAAFGLTAAAFGMFPHASFAEEAFEARRRKRRVGVAGMKKKDFTHRFRNDATCRKMHARMTNRGLRFRKGKGGVLTTSWSGKQVSIMAIAYESVDSYGFAMWLRNGRRIKGCYSIKAKKGGTLREAGLADSREGEEPVIKEVENPDALRVQAEQEFAASSTFECNVCRLAVELVIGFGCGAGAAVVAAAACGPGALACAFIVASVQAAICELMFYPVSRRAVCAGLGYC